MNVQWPWVLLFLLLIPLLIAAYIWILRRRRRFTVRYSSLSLIRAAAPERSRWRRHIPFALMLIGLTSLVLAMARPQAVVAVPMGRATVILALDVSRSMCSTDIPPNRLAAAQEAAKSFVENQDPGTQIGIVAFAGFAELVLPPTNDQQALLEAIDKLTTARRTAIGSAILRSLDAIAEVNPNVAPVNMGRFEGQEMPTPAPEGFYQPDIVVLLTDGRSNQGAFPLDAAQIAVERGIHVYTIGFGTERGSAFGCTPEQQGGAALFGDTFGNFGGGNFGGGGFGGGRRRGLDEETLQTIAHMTDAEYYLAESADELHEVFSNLPKYYVTLEEEREISVAFTGLGALLSMLALVLSQRWNPLT
ncbi:MAG: VWA domain-containing protein [Caldilineaceae bacterium]|nr:VWA domain-containing protein [Caldilineaceae bacterium]